MSNTERKTIGSNWKSYQNNFCQKKPEVHRNISYRTEVERNKNVSCQMKVQGNNNKGNMSRLPVNIPSELKTIHMQIYNTNICTY